ncbi:MAG: hypothetical protein J3R72DRAFT_451348 [Linnemannia gamsii]|nr:MAG: hypothetical protein J3R72DRAFT_451348 [Linnemannia gamsii]
MRSPPPSCRLTFTAFFLMPAAQSLSFLRPKDMAHAIARLGCNSRRKSVNGTSPSSRPLAPLSFPSGFTTGAPSSTVGHAYALRRFGDAFALP